MSMRPRLCRCCRSYFSRGAARPPRCWPPWPPSGWRSLRVLSDQFCSVTSGTGLGVRPRWWCPCSPGHRHLPDWAAAHLCQVGLIAPALLAVMRFCRAWPWAANGVGPPCWPPNGAPGRRGWAAMWPQMGAPFGFLLADALFLVLITLLGHGSLQPALNPSFYSWGWRIPFLLSSVMVVIGLYVRLRLAETPVFTRSTERGERVKAPLVQVLQELAPADHRHLRDRRRLLAVLHRDDLGAELRP